MEIKNAKEIKINTNISPLISLAIIDPNKDPIIIPIIHFLITLLSILSNFKWDLIDEIEVKTITAKDEATETCITTSIEYPRVSNTK